MVDDCKKKEDQLHTTASLLQFVAAQRYGVDGLTQTPLTLTHRVEAKSLAFFDHLRLLSLKRGTGITGFPQYLKAPKVASGLHPVHISMRAIIETTRTGRVHVHYVTAGAPGRVEENFEAFFLEHGDLSLEEVLQDQETLYQSLQASNGNDRAKASASGGSNMNRGQSGEEKRNVEEGESSHAADVKSQIELDEAVAIQLQFSSLNESTGTEAGSAVDREVDSTDSTARVVRRENIDPDNMTYEELRSLGEAIGTESRGLSEELISYLEPFTYSRGGFFSKKEKTEECVICKGVYKNREKVISLPCKHQYHSKCITRWLKLNKACPVCNEEVFGS